MADETPKPIPPGKPGYSFGAMRGKGKKSEVQKQVDRDQGTLMLHARLHGKSLSEIAKIFDCSQTTVVKRLSIPEIHEIYKKAQEVIAGRLIPAALEVMEEKLVVARDGDMAKEVVFGVGLLSKNVKVAATFTETQEETFDDWRRKRLTESVVRDIAAAEAAAPTPAPPSDTLEADIRSETDTPPNA